MKRQSNGKRSGKETATSNEMIEIDSIIPQKGTTVKVTVFVGSARKNHTYRASEQFLNNLDIFGEVEYEIVRLSDYKLEPCIGCKSCMDKDEGSCPLKDDRNILIEKLMSSDGVVFASPNYLFHESALMKLFIERLSFFSHRPFFFGKTFTSIVSQGFMGGKDIVKYFSFVGERLGFNVVKGSCITTLEPMTEKGQKKIDKMLYKQSEKFYSKLVRKEYPSPTLFNLMIFRMSRTSMRLMLDDKFRDYRYFKKKGWFESDYYYSVRLNPIKKLMGKFFDILAVRMTANR
jgi:multimeric flavodoxin WrbA